MKHILVIFLFGFLAIETFGQQSVDVGFFGGAGTYFGDMTKIDIQKSVNPAYGSFLRFNFNPRYALRFNVLNGNIGAVEKFDFEASQADPNYKPLGFKKNVLDISLQFEFNYMKYIIGQKETPYSTYLFAGVGMQTYNYDIPYATGKVTGSEITPTIPFGMGFKVNLSRRWGLGIEGGLRKSFSDKLDNLDDPLSHINSDGKLIKYADLLHNNDWTAYLGVHLVYKLIYGTKPWQISAVKHSHFILDWGIWNNIRKE